MANLVDVMAYICKKYPHKNELSKARLTKLVYLADWRSAIVNRRQLTNIKWVFNHYGPYVDDVVITAMNHPAFNVVSTLNSYGANKSVVKLQYDLPINLRRREKNILDHVIEQTKNLYFNEFIELVYSTYPVVSSNRFAYLNLVALAEEYENQIKPLL